MKPVLFSVGLLSVVAACQESGACITPGAVRIDGVCDCPGGGSVEKVDGGGEQCIAAVGATSSTGTDGGTAPPSGSATGDAGTAAPPLKAGGDAGIDDVAAATSGQDAAAPGSSEPGKIDVPSGDSPVGADASTPGAPDASPGQGSSTPCVAAAETCDGKDNDCDGKADEDGVCAPAAPVYTCPPGACAEWPMPDRVPGAKVAPKYTVGSDTVTDEVTKLVWQRNMPAPPYPGCTSGDGGCLQSEASAYCENLVLAGVSDWRLPSKIELESIVDDTSPGASLNVDSAFTSATSYNRLWTSSAVGIDANTHWTVLFRDGDTLHNANNREQKLARCVRAGVRPMNSRYTLFDDEAVDNWTGLRWQRTADASLRGWQAAGAYCLTVGPGFRLPTRKELMTLFDATRSGVPLEPAVFPDALAVPNDLHGYWSSTRLNSPDYGVNVACTAYPAGSLDVTVSYGGAGYESIDGDSAVARTRCVR